MNTKSGGPAALGGFLYQLIMHLDWVEKLVLSNDESAHRLVLEPRGGGDAHIHLAGKRIIEQYKAREGGGTWSIREIVHGPFVDFVRAAQTQRTDDDQFRFVTDGRVSHQDSLLNFLDRCAECSKKGATLDQQKIHSYRSIGRFTDHALFEWIRKEIESGLTAGPALDDTTIEHVLSRVKLVDAVDSSAMQARLEALLRACLSDPTTASKVREQLIGRLLMQLANGAVTIEDAKEFLRSNGIDVSHAVALADRCRRLATLLRKVVVHGSRQYRSEHDVRRPPHWNLGASPILAIAGSPGSGKTWQLISLALDLADRGLPCAFQTVQSDVLRSLDLAAQMYWNGVLERPTTTDISALKPGIKEATRDARGSLDPGPWLVVLLDGPLSIGDLPTLIDKVVQDEGIRIAVTVPLDVAERLQAEYGQTVQVVQVSKFTPSELMAYFDTFGIEWSHLPSELFSLLRQPLLANLFVRSGHTSFLEAPQSEYDLFEQLWKNISTSTGASVLRELARYAFEHPTAHAFAVEHAISSYDRETLEGLGKAGWIEIDHRSHIQFAHDRLLNWALADAIVTDIVPGKISHDDLPTKLGLSSNQNSRFGYLLMDVFWKLTSARLVIGVATELLSKIETEAYEIHSTDFYQYLLPTLGINALGLMAERMAVADQAPPNVHLIVSAARAIGRQFADHDPVPTLSQYAREWIGESRGMWTEVGLALAEEARLVDLIDVVKAIHFFDVQDVRNDFSAYSNYEASFAALKACVGKAPDWLRDQIQSTEDPEELNALAFQLLHLEHPSAPLVWKACRDALVSGTESARGVLVCIQRFRDGGLVDYVTNALGSSDPHNTGLAFCVLASIAPDEAFACLDRMEKSELYMRRNQWVTELYSARPTELERWLERTLDEGYLQHELFAVISNYASPQLTQAVVGRFSRQVVQRQENDNPWLGNWAKILTAPSVRAQTQRLVGSDAESALVAIAKRRIDPSRAWHDHLLEDARAILLAIGGSGIVELLTFELSRTRGRSAYRALELAPLVARPEIASALVSHIAKSGTDSDADEQLISNHDAMVGLAALDAEQELEQAVQASPIHGFPLDGLALREGQHPFDASLVERIRAALLQADTLSDHQLVGQLILAALAQAPDLATAIEQVLLRRGATQTVFVHGAHAALQYSVTESLARWSQRWLRNKETRRLAIALHLKSGSNSCERNLLSYARAIAVSDPTLAAEIVAHLPSEGEVGLGADALAIEIFNAAPYAVDCYDRVARWGSRTERETLRQRAYYGDRTFLNLRRSAIEALAAIDPLEAARAALWLAEQVPAQESFAVDIVVRFGSDDHFLQLIGICYRLDRQSLWDHLGRTFRQRTPDSQKRLLQEIGSRDELAFRRAFAELGGWLGEDQRCSLLSRMALEDSRIAQQALRVALRRIEELKALKVTVAALGNADRIQAAALLHTALAANEPFLLSNRDDELYVGKALERLPKYFRFFASKRLSNLRQKWKPSDN